MRLQLLLIWPWPAQRITARMERSLLQCADSGDLIPKSVEDIVVYTDRQVRELFCPEPQAHLEQRRETGPVVVSEAPGMEPYRPGSAHPGISSGRQLHLPDYIDSMEGATMSGHRRQRPSSISR